MTHLSSDLPTDEVEQILQQSRVVLKTENILEFYTSNISFDPSLDEPISEPALSKIDDNNFQQLESKVIQSKPDLSLGQGEVSSGQNNLMDLHELWKLAYANFRDPMHEAITAITALQHKN